MKKWLAAIWMTNWRAAQKKNHFHKKKNKKNKTQQKKSQPLPLSLLTNEMAFKFNKFSRQMFIKWQAFEYRRKGTGGCGI